jgi:hypothetical protein
MLQRREGYAMLSLAEFQHTMAEDLLDGGTRTVQMQMQQKGSVPATEALRVHQNTVLWALANALRLTFWTVERLVGERRFDLAAVAYARAYPPRSADLSTYGKKFPSFLGTYAPIQELPYLADVARFDLAVERCANKPLNARGMIIRLDDQVSLELLGSLECLQINYPADLIRDALEIGQDDMLGEIDMQPTLRSFALWRSASGPTVKVLSAPATAFLTALLGGCPCEVAMTSALECATSDDTFQLIQSEIFLASFARVTHDHSKGSSR